MTDDLASRLRAEGSARYHNLHPFNLRMHAGELSRVELQRWVENRYYYQTRIPIKDALIVAKLDDPALRRRWLRRIVDHDGDRDGEGGLAAWLELARGVGLDVDAVRSCARVLPAVRFACDAYVTFVREHDALEAIAASLTELFAPDLMSKRIAAWETHYPWVAPEALGYFRSRVSRAHADGDDALAYVTAHARTREQQDRCVDAIVMKTQVLWSMLDAIAR